MKKIIATILTITFLLAIVATPSYKVNSPSFKVGASILNNKGISNNVTTQ